MFPKIVVSQNGWFIMEKPIKHGMIWGYHDFWKHPYVLQFFLTVTLMGGIGTGATLGVVTEGSLISAKQKSSCTKWVKYTLSPIIMEVERWRYQHLQRGAKWFLKGINSPSLRV